MRFRSALTHLPSPAANACELTYLERQPLDLERTRRQHQEYCQALRDNGLEVTVLDCNLDHPDAAFIEDCAVVLQELAVAANLGAASRRAEARGVAEELRRRMPVLELPPPARLEGGDVLQWGRRLLVGLSTRTNQAGLEALREHVAPLGYAVSGVRVAGCLHLKTGCTALDEETLLLNPRWIAADDLPPARRLEAPEAWGANVLRLESQLLASQAHPRTLDLLVEHGYPVRGLDISEFAKAEAGLTCLSLLLP